MPVGVGSGVAAEILPGMAELQVSGDWNSSRLDTQAVRITGAEADGATAVRAAGTSRVRQSGSAGNWQRRSQQARQSR